VEFRSRIRVGAARSRCIRSRDGDDGCRLDRRTHEHLLGLALLIWAGLSPCSLDAAEPVFIGRVVVNTAEVFGPEEDRGFLNRGANALHIVTLESTVRRLLIFEEGDVYDPAVLAEAERNLRALGLFRSVSIVAGEVRDGVVDVQVNTQDAWTVQVGLSAGSGGGDMRGGIALGEKNFLGTGSLLRLAFAKDQERTYRSVEILTPNFFLPFTTAHVLYANNSDGSAKILEVRRPFYSTASPWSAEIAYADTRRDEFTYVEGGAVESTFGADHFRLLAAYGIALSAREGNASRLSIGLDLREDRFRAASTGGTDVEALPADRRFRYVFLQYEALHSDFLKWNYVNHDVRYEDIGVGPRLLLRLGISPAAFGVAETTGIVGAEVGAGFRVGTSGFVQARVGWDSRIGPSLENSLLSANVLYVRRFETTPRQTFVAQIAALRGWNLDRDVQIFADAQAGLRAYHLRAFEGDTRVILNLEHRIFSGRQLFGLISPGVAVFADAGLVGGPTRSLSLTEIKMDAGIGLRLAMSWAPVMNVFRIDAGYAFQRDPAGHRGWLISFSTGQAF
jgi:Surface antigen variable number repeat